MISEVRTIDMSISRDLLKQFIEEKIEQFGFKPTEDILSINLVGVPETIPMNVEFKEYKEVQIINHNG